MSGLVEFVEGFCVFSFLLVGLIGLQVMVDDAARKVFETAGRGLVCRACHRLFSDVEIDGRLQVSEDGGYCSPGCERAAKAQIGGTISEAAKACARLICGEGAEAEEARKGWEEWIVRWSPRLSVEDCELERVVRIHACLAAAFRAQDEGRSVCDAFAAEFRLAIKDGHKREIGRLERMRAAYVKCWHARTAEKSELYRRMIDAVDERMVYLRKVAAEPMAEEMA